MYSFVQPPFSLILLFLPTLKIHNSRTVRKCHNAYLASSPSISKLNIFETLSRSNTKLLYKNEAQLVENVFDKENCFTVDNNTFS
jgi:hypothetical protein